VIIGGLYWRRGTTAGAWTAVILGAILCLIGIAVDKQWPWIVGRGAALGYTLPPKFWLNYLQSTFASVCIAGVAYVVVSLLTGREKFDLDRLLHRGAYAETAADASRSSTNRRHFSFAKIMGYTSDFTFWDKVVAGGVFWWSMLLLGLNLGIAAWNLSANHRWPDSWWAKYWLVTAIAMPMGIALLTLVWFGIGGIIDIKHFFHALRTMTRNVRDDGRVHDDTKPPERALDVRADEPARPAEKVTV
jgi:SSS family solute:Na+ symporter